MNKTAILSFPFFSNFLFFLFSFSFLHLDTPTYFSMHFKSKKMPQKFVSESDGILFCNINNNNGNNNNKIWHIMICFRSTLSDYKDL